MLHWDNCWSRSRVQKLVMSNSSWSENRATWVSLSSDDVKMKIVYFFMLSKIEVSTFQKINIFCHFEVHLGSKISENGYIANIGHLHLNCLNFSKLSCFMVFSHTSIRKQVTSSRKIKKQINKKCQDVINGDWFSLRYLGSILGYLVIIYHKRILGMLCIP